jgi:hypothetical protein
MLWLRLIIAFGLPCLCGYSLVGLAEGNKGSLHPVERLCLGYGAGLGLLTMGLFLLGFAGVKYTAITASLPLVILTLIFFAARRFLDRRNPSSGPILHKAGTRELNGPDSYLAHPLVKLLCALAVAWICWKIAFVLYEGFVRPIRSQDAWWNWSSGAKFFFYERGLLLDPASEFFFGKGYRPFLGYPLLNSLAQVWVSLMIGTFHESLAKAWVVFCYLSVLGLFFFSVKREAGTVIALASLFLLSSAPLMLYHSIGAYADLPLALFVFSGGILLFRYMETRKCGYAALAGLFFSIGAFTKNEGVVFLFASAVSIVIFSLAAKEGRLKGILSFAIPASVYIAPWLIFKIYYGIGYGHGYGIGVGSVDEASSILWSAEMHYEVIAPFFKELLFTVNHGLIFPFLAFLTAIGLRTVLSTNIKYLYLIIVMMICTLLFVFIGTHDYVYVLNRTSVNRAAITFLPLTFFITAILASRLLRDKE